MSAIRPEHCFTIASASFEQSTFTLGAAGRLGADEKNSRFFVGSLCHMLREHNAPVGRSALVDFGVRKRGTVETLVAFPETSSAKNARCTALDFAPEARNPLVLYVRNMEWHPFPASFVFSRSGFSKTERAESGVWRREL